MKRFPLFVAALLVGGILLAGCDAVAPAADTADAPAVLLTLDRALADADRSFAALDDAEQTDAAYLAVLDATLARHFGDAAPAVKVADGETERRFGPFAIAFDQQINHTGQLAGAYPGTFDVYVYNLVGTQTGAFEVRMTSPDAEIGALLRINGQQRDIDSNTDQVTVETQPVTAPSRAVVGVAFLAPPPGGFPAAYQLESKFDRLN